MSPQDNSDDSINVYSDWLNDNDKEHFADCVKEDSVNTWIEDRFVSRQNIGQVGTNFGEDVGCSYLHGDYVGKMSHTGSRNNEGAAVGDPLRHDRIRVYDPTDGCLFLVFFMIVFPIVLVGTVFISAIMGYRILPLTLSISFWIWVFSVPKVIRIFESRHRRD